MTPSEYPETIAAIQSLGGNDAERAKALDVRSTKTIERLRRRLPKPLLYFLMSPHAEKLLLAMLADVRRRQNTP